jgi:hypothetical protein
MWDKRQRGYRGMGYEIKKRDVVARNDPNLKQAVIAASR